MHTYIQYILHIHIYTYICMLIYIIHIMHTHTYIYICMHILIYTAYMYIYIHTYTCTYTAWRHTNMSCNHLYTHHHLYIIIEHTHNKILHPYQLSKLIRHEFQEYTSYTCITSPIRSYNLNRVHTRLPN